MSEELFLPFLWFLLYLIYIHNESEGGPGFNGVFPIIFQRACAGIPSFINDREDVGKAVYGHACV